MLVTQALLTFCKKIIKEKLQKENKNFTVQNTEPFGFGFSLSCNGD